MFHVLVILWGNAKPTATSRNATVLSIHFAILSSNQPWLAINESSNMKAIYKWWMFYCYVWLSEGDPSLSKAQKIRITRGGHILEYLEILCIYACIHIYEIIWIYCNLLPNVCHILILTWSLLDTTQMILKGETQWLVLWVWPMRCPNHYGPSFAVKS